MTYPPQQPGPYGQQPQQPGGYGQQPDPWSQQQQPTQYQGLGGYPGGGGPVPPPPRKSNTGKTVAIAVIAVLLVGGAGTGVYFLTKESKPSSTGGDSPSTTPTTKKTTPKTSGSQPPTSGDDSESSTPSQSEGAGTTGDQPQKIVDAYVDAYQNKSFSSVTNGACGAYKKKYGTDTTELEKSLADFTITATPKNAPEVKGNTASAQIDLTLSKGTESKNASIKIKIVKEGGQWRFCGEEKA